MFVLWFNLVIVERTNRRNQANDDNDHRRDIFFILDFNLFNGFESSRSMSHVSDAPSSPLQRWCVVLRSVTIGTLYPGYRSYKALINSDLREVVKRNFSRLLPLRFDHFHPGLLFTLLDRFFDFHRLWNVHRCSSLLVKRKSSSQHHSIRSLIVRFPFYYWIKIFLVLWLSSSSGSNLLYKRFIQPVLKEREQVRLKEMERLMMINLCSSRKSID